MAAISEIRSLLGRVVRGLLLLAGIVVFGIGLLIVFVPELEQFVPTEAMIERLGSDYVVVATVGVAAVGFSLLVVLIRSVSGVDEATPPVVEAVESGPYPGEAFDRSIESRFDASTAGRDRLREAAVRTVMRSENSSRSRAEEAISRGTWTDDDVASRFLAKGKSGRNTLLRTILGDDERARRTVEAIERISGGSEDGSNDLQGRESGHRASENGSSGSSMEPIDHGKGTKAERDGRARTVREDDRESVGERRKSYGSEQTRTGTGGR